MTFAQVIKNWWKKNRHTRDRDNVLFGSRAVSKKLGMKSPSAFTNIKVGRSCCSLTTAKKLARMMHLNKRCTDLFLLLWLLDSARIDNQTRRGLLRRFFKGDILYGA